MVTGQFFNKKFRHYHFSLIIPQENSVFGRIQESPCLQVYISPKCNFSLMDRQILIKLYTVTVQPLRMCMKADNPVRKISREIIIYANDILCDLLHSSSFNLSEYVE